jgi:squalene-hopene/tetraprenyl-beta-curcumene cyclase
MGLKKHLQNICLLMGVFIFCFISVTARAEAVKEGSAPAKSDVSTKNEVLHSIEKGLKWLQEKQDPKGCWSQAEYPALSGLVLTAFMGDPEARFNTGSVEFINKGYNYILQCVQPDGGIYASPRLSNYNTAVCVTSLFLTKNPAYEKTIKNARNFLVGLQGDFGEKGKTDNQHDGGVSYNAKTQGSDLSNTVITLEALYYTKNLEKTDKGESTGVKELNWAAAQKFIERCQNLPEYNDQSWSSDDPDNKGGFVYFPGNSTAGEETLKNGKTALRSYGSISYAGLLSYIYTSMDKNDPRVTAVYDWLKKNYTLDENPGMGKQGLYFYYQLMAKALNQYGINEINMENGNKVNWRKDLALKLVSLQKEDGSWVNENGRWWETDPVLVTAYSLITLEIVYEGL